MGGGDGHCQYVGGSDGGGGCDRPVVGGLGVEHPVDAAVEQGCGLRAAGPRAGGLGLADPAGWITPLAACPKARQYLPGFRQDSADLIGGQFISERGERFQVYGGWICGISGYHLTPNDRSYIASADRNSRIA